MAEKQILLPAFPTPALGSRNGMDLRDYFAAKAMQGLYANSCDEFDFDGVANAAYKTADAMIKARSA